MQTTVKGYMACDRFAFSESFLYIYSAVCAAFTCLAECFNNDLYLNSRKNLFTKIYLLKT